MDAAGAAAADVAAATAAAKVLSRLLAGYLKDIPPNKHLLSGPINKNRYTKGCTCFCYNLTLKSGSKFVNPVIAILLTEQYKEKARLRLPFRIDRAGRALHCNVDLYDKVV